MDGSRIPRSTRPAAPHAAGPMDLGDLAAGAGGESGRVRQGRRRSAGGRLRPSQGPGPGEPARLTGVLSPLSGRVQLRPSGALTGTASAPVRPSKVPTVPGADVLRGSGQPLAALFREEKETTPTGLPLIMRAVKPFQDAGEKRIEVEIEGEEQPLGLEVDPGDTVGDLCEYLAGTLKVDADRLAVAGGPESKELGWNEELTPGRSYVVRVIPQAVGEHEQCSIEIKTETETTDIRSASDLLVCLVSHPVAAAETPKNFADSGTLLSVLRKLEKEGKRVLGPFAVWDALREVISPKYVEDESSSSEGGEEESGGGFWGKGEELGDGFGFWGKGEEPGDWSNNNNESSGSWAGDEKSSINDSGDDAEGWPEGSWGKEEDKDAVGVENEIPREFRRQMTADEYNEQLKKLQAKLEGRKLVGVHGTELESLGPLIKEGVSDYRVGSRNNIGKGRGFYIIPTEATPSKEQLAKAEKSAKYWGKFVVAVYLPEGCEIVDADEGENVQTMEQKYGGENCYYKFGKEEAVIPPSLFQETILVRDPADIAMADPGLPAEVSEKSALSFVTTKPTKTKKKKK